MPMKTIVYMNLICLFFISCSKDNKFEFPLAVFGFQKDYFNETQPNNNTPNTNPTENTDTIAPASIVGEAYAFMFTATMGLSRFDDLLVEFDQSINTSTVTSSNSLSSDSFVLKEVATNQIVEGRIFWFGTRKLYFDPYKELKSNTVYNVELKTIVTATTGKHLDTLQKIL